MAWNKKDKEQIIVPNKACNKKDKEEIIVEVTAEANEVKKLNDAWRIVLDA